MAFTKTICLLLAGSVLLGAADEFGDFPTHKYDPKVKRAMSDFAQGLADPLGEKDVEKTLQSFLETSGSPVHTTRVASLSASLRPLFVALPQDDEGRLGYQTARYALHRFMMQSRGWFIRGLESGDDVLVHRSGVQTEWVPAYLQGLLTQRSGKLSASLEDLTVMVATLEDLIFAEIQMHFKAIYRYLNISSEEPVSKNLVGCAMDAFIYYTLTFDLVQTRIAIDPFRLPGNTSFAKRREKLCVRPLLPRMSGYKPSLNRWKQSVLTAVGDSHDDSMSFSQAVRFAQRFAASFYEHNAEDCNTLKDALVSMEGQNGSTVPGQVALSTYYSKKRVGFFAFNEKIDFLRESGILDETHDPTTISVPNYVGSRINCIESSTLYSVCCQLECDEMLAQLEMNLEAPFGTAEEIIDVLTKLVLGSSSDARHAALVELFERLRDLEQMQGGYVPIHGEAFALWMNNVFPRECPQPHPDRSTSRPLTAAEWLRDVNDPWAADDRAVTSKLSTRKSHGLLLLMSVVCAMCWFALRPESATSAKLASLCRERFGCRGVTFVRPWLACVSIAAALSAFLENIPIGTCILVCSFFLVAREMMRKAWCASAGSNKLASCYDEECDAKYT
eukprot:TRINITY_DN22072_c0_g1_i1.p1 TRINITY_DN22072_c0_g1~~TRINITY_DN22072_c0_g1_i1.p1  ORF type:complete len:617 (+),score=82.95 TRINITY_DN22072_c0_g1_i1:129-1979(+)